jgi:hypothetical protein
VFVFAMEKKLVFCEAGTGFINIINGNLRLQRV